jgi:ABC-2 type transport system permease protein
MISVRGLTKGYGGTPAVADLDFDICPGTVTGYLALTGLTGLGVGTILRHSAAAVATLIGGLFVLPVITGAGARATGKFMPELIAGNSLAAVKPVAGFTWSPWLELGIVALYPLLLLAAGSWLLERRDA